MPVGCAHGRVAGDAVIEDSPAAARDDRDGSARVAAVLGGIVRHEHLKLADRIQRRHGLHAGVRAGVEVRNAVDGHVLLVASPAQDVDIVHAAGRGHLAAIGGVDHSREKRHGVHDIPSADGQVVQFSAVSTPERSPEASFTGAGSAVAWMVSETSPSCSRMGSRARCSPAFTRTSDCA